MLDRPGPCTPEEGGHPIYGADNLNNKQGFEWFATATLAKRGKNATDLRPYTLLSAWAHAIPCRMVAAPAPQSCR